MACKFVNGSALNTQSPQCEKVYENDNGGYETPVTIISQQEEKNPYDVVGLSKQRPRFVKINHIFPILPPNPDQFY